MAVANEVEVGMSVAGGNGVEVVARVAVVIATGVGVGGITSVAILANIKKSTLQPISPPQPKSINFFLDIIFFSPVG